jgi:peptide/nickel transport system permease protein
MGTDRLGRDVLSRTIYGARVSLLVAFAAVALGTSVGLALGIISGYLSGAVDRSLQMMIDLMLAFPGIVVLLAITAAIGPSLGLVTLSIGVLIAPIVTRVIRGTVLREKQAPYVEAARGLGATGPRVILRHIFPNVASTAVVLATQLIPLAILTEASLSFLGFGARPPTASWGGDLSGDSQLYFTIQPWMAIAPGVALTLAVLAFTFLGDWARDFLDPRTRGGSI